VKLKIVNHSLNSTLANPAPVETQHQEAVRQQQLQIGRPIPIIRIRTIRPREIIEARGATAWAEKMDYTAVSDEVVGCISKSDEEFEDLLRQLKDDK
jgi:hypothetical protein